ncbi:hypothetical protein Bca52824_063801 [Brassica carinata]|nr:hypothetical protein Bca52824_063801 [Brassica carinata]
MEELLPHDVIEYILERLDVKTLLKFTTVSKQWKSTIIQCRSFQTRQMLRLKQSGKTHVVFVSLYGGSERNSGIEALRTLAFYEVCNTSCDGLICIYDRYDGQSIVVNPTTRWHRTIPPCNYHLAVPFNRRIRQPSPGFGKDKINGTYNVVWLYNSAELGLKNKSFTTCEVFDVTTNAWRYIVPASPYLIHRIQAPLYCDGSLRGMKPMFFIPQPPFLHGLTTPNLIMCSLDDRLCVSPRIWLRQHVMWSFDSADKTWKKIYSIDLKRTSSGLRDYITPLSVLGKDKLLLYDRESSGVQLVAYDLRTKYYDISYKCKDNAYVLCYVPSLISIL